MKKIHMIVQKRDVDSALMDLQDMGTIHVEPLKTMTGTRLQDIRDKIALLKRIITGLEPYQAACDLKQESCKNCWTEKADEIIGRINEIEVFKENNERLSSLIEEWRPWGDFSMKDIRDLSERGIFVKLYDIPVKEKDKLQLPEGSILHTVFSDGKIDHCVFISHNNEDELAASRVFFPELGFEEMMELRQKTSEKIAKLEVEMTRYCDCYACFKKVLAEHEDLLRFEEVACSMEEKEMLTLLKGFCPVDKCYDLEENAKKRKWGLLVEDITDEDNVPTLLRNPKWVEMIKPVFNFIDVLPGYREMDVSLVFLIFFSIFFGMLIGDAGYGIIFLLINMFIHKKAGAKMKDKTFFHLFYLLCTVTITWGVLTGTYFGQAWLTGKVNPVSPWLTDMNNLIFLCFMIAAVHLSIGHIWQIVRLFPSPVFLSQVGWLAIVWAMFMAANMFVLSWPFPAAGMPLLAGGAALVIFFTKPNKNFLKAAGPGLAGFLMNFINSFSDVVSYIRLFAVGLATVAVADAFNEMALGVGFSSVFAGLGSSIILIIGHTLNMVLALLAVLVHGVRLNVLEFPGHLNLEWAGFSYRPFKKVK